jgi:capsular exopolysaccharide synthesis family protein
MSHIFDGLQRSESEPLGPEFSPLSGVTELLQHAERRVASKWETTALTEQSNVMKDPGREASFGLPEIMAVANKPDTLVETEVLSNEGLNPFAQFQPLKVSIAPESHLVSIVDSGSPAAEAFRLLGVRLRHLRRDRALKKVLITSTIPQEGKSTVAGNLACTLALKTQQRVLMLEGDLRRPALAKMFGLEKSPGLSEWLDGEHSLMASIYHLAEPGVWILPAGSTPSNALELLQSGKLSTLMAQLDRWFDWIIIDSPPMLPLADTSVWMRLSDGILLTTRQGTTEKRKLQRGLEAVESKKLIGALVNSSKNTATNDYYSYGPTNISRTNELRRGD